MMVSYKETLESIKKGVLYSKNTGGEIHKSYKRNEEVSDGEESAA